MFKFIKKQSSHAPEKEKKSWKDRLSSGLKKTKQQLSNSLQDLIKGKKTIDKTLFDELEEQLLIADTGVEMTTKILEQLTAALNRKELNSPDALIQKLQSILKETLDPVSKPLHLNTSPFVLLVVGVNGAGKTTSIAKMAHYFQSQNKKVMIAAGDTFRAAATEQLQVWGERHQVPVIAQQSGADSAAVIYDALHSAKAKQIDLLIADTAGRLHTQDHLMSELEKIKRVLKKLDPEAPHETMLVLDASMGQNALMQAKQFHDAIDLDSIAITKLDGTAKGGIVFAIANQLQLPYRFIGVGEGINDLKPFSSTEFVSALFD